MLTVLEAIQQRRSIRSFRSDPVPPEAIKEMLEAARLAPSGSNRQPWRFLVVTDPAEKARLRKICLDQAFIEQAPLVFLCCADLNALKLESRRQRYQEFAEAGVMETLSGRLADPAFRETFLLAPDSDRVSMTAAVANTYLAIEHLVLAATGLGLGTCWVGALGGKGEIHGLFGLPTNIVIVAVIPVGYPTAVPRPRPRLPLSQVLLRPLP